MELLEDYRPKTIICDIDGTIINHQSPSTAASLKHPEYVGAPLMNKHPSIEKFEEWDKKGYYIILMTGRKESMRFATESYLSDLGFFWDQLIMGIGGGPRVLINDRKPDGRETAFAINVDRNKGIHDITV